MYYNIKQSNRQIQQQIYPSWDEIVIFVQRVVIL